MSICKAERLGATGPAFCPHGRRVGPAHALIAVLCLVLLLSPTASGARAVDDPRPAAAGDALGSAGIVLEDKPAADAPEAKITTSLRRASRSVFALGGTRQAVMAARPDRLTTPLTRVSGDGMLQCYVDYASDPQGLQAAIRAAGGRVQLVSARMSLIQAELPYDQLSAVAADTRVKRVRPPGYAITRIGAANSQGDALHRCDVVRSTQGLSGSGRKVGIISDGINGITLSQASGDIPATYEAQSARSDGNLYDGAEGTAMMEIVHDLAPGAALAFSNPNTSAEMVAAIDILDSAFHCNVICDDLGFADEPFFEDGPIAARISQVVANGGLYCSAAGNEADQNYYEGDYVGQTKTIASRSMNVQNFGAGDWNMAANIQAGGSIIVILQWNDPWGGSGNDYDLLLTNSTGKTVLASSEDYQSGTGYPLEALIYTNSTSSSVSAYVVVRKYSGAARHLKIVSWGNAWFTEYYTAAGSSYGHPASLDAICCGALRATTPNSIETFSSRGPVRVDFPALSYRSKPDLCGIDGVSVTANGGFYNPFYGTSAAAPHVAAVCALVWSGNPSLSNTAVRNLVQTTAVDLGTTGFDNTYGYGRADAVNALAALDTTPPTVVSILRQAPADATTGAGEVTWRVTFSEPVRADSISTADFMLVDHDGTIAGEAISQVSPTSGNATSVDVTAVTGAGSGTLRLDVVGATATIPDLAGNNLIDGFTTGETYTIVKPPIPGDFDSDGDVDDADLALLLGCLSGPAIPSDPGVCKEADLDQDSDVDQEDFGRFQRCLSGAGNPGDPGC